VDNPYYSWSPIVARAPLRWPGDARLAVCLLVNIEQIEWLPPRDSLLPPSTVRFGPYPEIFDVHEVSTHEYGNRVGIFRVMDVLDRHGIRATAPVDAASAERSPELVRRCVAHEWELMGHGLSASRMLSEQMEESEERDYLERSLVAVEQVSGRRPAGWIGTDYGESTRTVALLAELGVRYVCDWPNDEQPYAMSVPAGEITSLPVAVELDDVYVLRERGVSIQHWLRMVTESFDRLWIDAETSGRLLILNLHPYVIGQPFRIRYLAQAVEHIASRANVWLATAGEVAEWYRAGST
jgi:allantoinase